MTWSNQAVLMVWLMAVVGVVMVVEVKGDDKCPVVCICTSASAHCQLQGCFPQFIPDKSSELVIYGEFGVCPSLLQEKQFDDVVFVNMACPDFVKNCRYVAKMLKQFIPI